MDSVTSFWGEVSFKEKVGAGVAKIVIASREITVREHDEGLHHIYCTSAGQKFFLVVRPVAGVVQELIAIYGPVKASQRLVLSLREEIAEGRVDSDSFSDWGPDYVLRTP